MGGGGHKKLYEFNGSLLTVFLVDHRIAWLCKLNPHLLLRPSQNVTLADEDACTVWEHKLNGALRRSKALQ